MYQVGAFPLCQVAWEGKAEDEVLTQEEVHRFATDEFSTELCDVPEITERQKVAPCPSSALDYMRQNVGPMLCDHACNCLGKQVHWQQQCSQCWTGGSIGTGNIP